MLRRLLALLVVGVVSACAPPVDDASAPVVDELAGMLADESAVNAIMRTTTLRVSRSYRSLDPWPYGDTYSRPECMAVNGNAMESVYRGSPYRDVRGELLTDPDPRIARSVDQAVVRFDTAAEAQAFVESTVQTWHECAGSVVTITSSSDRPTRSFRMEDPRVVDGVHVIAIEFLTSPGWRSSHAMRVEGNVVIDVRAGGYGIQDQPVRVVNAIAGRNRL